MENMGWGLKGWKFWLEDRKMSNLICNWVETTLAFRVIETGKRRTWDRTRKIIVPINKSVKRTFPLKD
jgi:dimethylaniline monooxygenase (N-oxide forming)